MTFDLFEYENQTHAKNRIAYNFKSIFLGAEQSSRDIFLQKIQADINDLIEYLDDLIGDTGLFEPVLKQVRKKYMIGGNVEFEDYHIATLYYKLPIDGRLTDASSNEVLKFHIEYLKQNQQMKKHERSATIRHFVHMIEILEYVYVHKIKMPRFVKNDFKNLLLCIEGGVVEVIQTQNNIDRDAVEIDELSGNINDDSSEDTTKEKPKTEVYIEPHFLVRVESVLCKVSSHFTLKNVDLKRDLKTLKSFYGFTKKGYRSATNHKDTSALNRQYFSNEFYTTSVKRMPVAKEAEEEAEEGISRIQRVQVNIGRQKNTKTLQNKKILAISAAIAKNKLQLPSLYTIPSIGFLSEFCRFLIERMKDGEDQYYYGLFVISVLMGIKPEQTVKLFFGNKKFVSDNNTVELLISDEYFAKYDRFDEKVGIVTKDAITYKIPFEFIHLIHSLYDLKVPYDEERFRQAIRKIKKDFHQKIHINFQKIWHCSMVHKKILHKNINTEMMLATKNIDKNASPIIYYTAASSRMEEYSNWLIEYMELLGIKAHLQKHIFGKAFSNERVINTSDETTIVGSRKLVQQEVFIEFMQKIEKLLKERRLDRYTRFNIYSIHVRYTLGLLLGTRDFGKSVDLGRISWKHNVIIIQEKGKEKNSGYRCIPLSELAKTIIRNYLDTLEKFGITTKSVVLFDGKNTVSLTLSTMKKAFRRFGFFKKHTELYEMLDLIPLNLGRHLITSMATEAGIRQDDMNAFMGHAVNGGELLGRFSMHDTQKYRSVFSVILNEIARSYKLKDIHELAAV